MHHCSRRSGSRRNNCDKGRAVRCRETRRCVVGTSIEAAAISDAAVVDVVDADRGAAGACACRYESLFSCGTAWIIESGNGVAGAGWVAAAVGLATGVDEVCTGGG